MPKLRKKYVFFPKINVTIIKKYCSLFYMRWMMVQYDI